MKQIHTFHVVERGARHVQEDLQLQDSAFSENAEITDNSSKYIGKYCIAVISDGHGSPQYFRSDRGSKFACQAAKEVFNVVMRNAKDITSHKNQANLKKLIYQYWQNFVERDLKQEPFTQEEFEKIQQKMQNADSRDIKKIQSYLNKYQQGDFLQKAYGCTLIAVLLCEKYTIAVQIGDGMCVAFYPDGSCNNPIPIDNKCMANQTSSLCDLNIDDCRIYIFEKEPIAVFVASDGIDDSFGNGEGLYNFYREICIKFAENGETYKDTLQQRLYGISKLKSKDDISIAGIYNLDQLVKLKDVFKKMYERGKKQIQLDELQDNQYGVSDYSLNTARSTMEKFEKAKNENQKDISLTEKIINILNTDIKDILNWLRNNDIPLRSEERVAKINQISDKIKKTEDDIQAREAELNNLRKQLSNLKINYQKISEKHKKIEEDKIKLGQNNDKLEKLKREKKENDTEYEEAKKVFERLSKEKIKGIRESEKLKIDIQNLTDEINQPLQKPTDAKPKEETDQNMLEKEQNRLDEGMPGKIDSPDNELDVSRKTVDEDYQKFSEKTISHVSPETSEQHSITENKSTMYQEIVSAPQSGEELMEVANSLIVEETK